MGGLNPDFETVKRFIASTFENAVLKESHCNMLIVSKVFFYLKTLISFGVGAVIAQMTQHHMRNLLYASFGLKS